MVRYDGLEGACCVFRSFQTGIDTVIMSKTIGTETLDISETTGIEKDYRSATIGTETLYMSGT